MSKQDHVALIHAQLKRAKAEPAQSPALRDDGLVDPIAELVFSFLLWEAPFSRARSAFKRVMDSAIDHNELRVTRPAEIDELLGKTYPAAEGRCDRMQFALDTIYRREYSVTLEGAIALGKREGRKYLESIDDMPPFVSARTSLVAFGSHAVPLDDRTMARLIETSVYEDGTTHRDVQGSLERGVKAADALEFHSRMVDWLDKPASTTGRKKITKKAPASSKKKATSGRKK